MNRNPRISAARLYFYITPAFILLDYIFGINVRVSALETMPTYVRKLNQYHDAHIGRIFTIHPNCHGVDGRCARCGFQGYGRVVKGPADGESFYCGFLFNIHF